MLENHQNILSALILNVISSSGSKESFENITKFVDDQVVEYEKICLCLSTLQFMIENGVNDSVIDAYIIAYALNDEKVIHIASMESSATLVSKLKSVINDQEL